MKIRQKALLFLVAVVAAPFLGYAAGATLSITPEFLEWTSGVDLSGSENNTLTVKYGDSVCEDVTWRVHEQALPAGVTFDKGVFSGTPTETGDKFTIVVSATHVDTSGSDAITNTVQVGIAIEVKADSQQEEEKEEEVKSVDFTCTSPTLPKDNTYRMSMGESVTFTLATKSEPPEGVQYVWGSCETNDSPVWTSGELTYTFTPAATGTYDIIFCAYTGTVFDVDVDDIIVGAWGCKVEVTASTPPDTPEARPTWMSVDLKTGLVSYHDYDFATATNTFNTEEYKSTKMAFRLVRAGDDYYVQNGAYTAQMTNSFYIGIFEVTAEQMSWMSERRSTGLEPAIALKAQGDCGREKIRGVKEAASAFGQGIVSNSVLGIFNSFVQASNRNERLVFDLPTEAMWEVAARAVDSGDSTQTNLNWYFGTDYNLVSQYAFVSYNDSDPDDYGNTSGVRVPGCKLPNAWGLYDIHGNLYELCLDGAEGTDLPVYQQGEWTETPQVTNKSKYQRLRGGSYESSQTRVQLSTRAYHEPGEYPDTGIRLSYICPSDDDDYVQVSESVTGIGDVNIPNSWFAGFPRFDEKYGSDYAAAAVMANQKRAADGSAMSVWQDYVTGCDPTDSNSVFTVSIALSNGVPYVSWSPYLNSNGTARIYRVLGKDSLTNEVWDAAAPTHHFFWVTIQMPDGDETSDVPGPVAGE